MTRAAQALRLLACAAAGMALTGCASREPQRERTAAAPAVLFECPSPPRPPGRDGTQRDVALYLVDLHAAHGACRSKLIALRPLYGERAAPSDVLRP